MHQKILKKKQNFFKNYLIDHEGKLKKNTNDESTILSATLPFKGAFNKKPIGFMPHFNEIASKGNDGSFGYLMDHHTNKKNEPKNVGPADYNPRVDIKFNRKDKHCFISDQDRSMHTKEAALGEFNLNKSTCPGAYDIPSFLGNQDIQHMHKHADKAYDTYNNRSLIINSLFYDSKNTIEPKRLQASKNRYRLDRRKQAKSFFDGSGLLSENSKPSKKVVDNCSRSQFFQNPSKSKVLSNSCSDNNIGNMFFNIAKDSVFSKKVAKNHYLENKRKNPIGFGAKEFRLVDTKITNSLKNIRSLSPLKKELKAQEFVGPGKYNDGIGSINDKQQKWEDKKLQLSQENKYVDHCYGYSTKVLNHKRPNQYRPKRYFEVPNSMFENKRNFSKHEVTGNNITEETENMQNHLTSELL